MRRWVPAAISETVNVVGKTADVLTNTAQVATNFKQDLIADAADQPRHQRHAAAGAGGAPDRSERRATRSRARRRSNRCSWSTAWRSTRTSAGTPYDLYIEDAIQETTVAVGGVSAEYGRFGGGVVNVITKSGGNLFAGSFRDTLNNDNWRTLTPFEMTRDRDRSGPQGHSASPRRCRRTNTRRRAGHERQAVVLHGRPPPVAGERAHARRDEHPVHLHRRDASATKSRARIRATSKHRFQGDYLKISQTQMNYTFNTSASMDLRSLGDREAARETCYTVNYNGVLSRQAVYVEARVLGPPVRLRRQRRASRPTSSRARCSSTRAARDRYWVGHLLRRLRARAARTTTTSSSRASYFLSKKGSGSHNMSFGYDNFNDIRNANNHQSGSDYRILGTSSYHPADRRRRPAVPGQQHDDHPVQPDAVAEPGAELPDALGVLQGRVARQRPPDARTSASAGTRTTGVDQPGNLTANDSGWSPRVGTRLGSDRQGRVGGHGQLRQVHRGHLESDRRLRRRPAGNPQTFQWFYQGPSINAAGAAHRRRPTRSSRCSTGSTPTAAQPARRRSRPTRRFRA